MMDDGLWMMYDGLWMMGAWGLSGGEVADEVDDAANGGGTVGMGLAVGLGGISIAGVASGNEEGEGDEGVAGSGGDSGAGSGGGSGAGSGGGSGGGF